MSGVIVSVENFEVPVCVMKIISLSFDIVIWMTRFYVPSAYDASHGSLVSTTIVFATAASRSTDVDRSKCKARVRSSLCVPEHGCFVCHNGHREFHIC